MEEAHFLPLYTNYKRKPPRTLITMVSPPRKQSIDNNWLPQSLTLQLKPREAAQAALKCLQAWWLGSLEFEGKLARKSLHPDLRVLVCTCQSLRTNRFCLRAIDDLASNRSLEEHVKRVADELSPDALFKLSLITCHFIKRGYSCPITQGLLQFFAEPEDKFQVVCQDIYHGYTAGDSQPSLTEFEHALEELLGFIEFQLIRGGWRLVYPA